MVSVAFSDLVVVKWFMWDPLLLRKGGGVPSAAAVVINFYLFKTILKATLEILFGKVG